MEYFFGELGFAIVAVAGAADGAGVAAWTEAGCAATVAAFVSALGVQETISTMAKTTLINKAIVFFITFLLLVSLFLKS
jgi:hypothetical protein